MRLQQDSHSFMYKLLLLIIIVLAAFRTLHPLQTPVRVLCYTPRKQIPGFRQLDGMVRRVAVNNEVLLMLVDKGYYSMFMSNYIYGKLYEITNVVVSVMDIGTYNVFPRIGYHIVETEESEYFCCILRPCLLPWLLPRVLF